MHFFNIKKGILLYLDKDRQELKEFIFDYDKKTAEALLENFMSTKSRIEMNVVPQALPDYPKDWQCRYCCYKEICDMAGPVELKWDEFKNKMEKEEVSQQNLGV